MSDATEGLLGHLRKHLFAFALSEILNGKLLHVLLTEAQTSGHADESRPLSDRSLNALHGRDVTITRSPRKLLPIMTRHRKLLSSTHPSSKPSHTRNNLRRLCCEKILNRSLVACTQSPARRAGTSSETVFACHTLLSRQRIVRNKRYILPELTSTPIVSHLHRERERLP